MEYPEEIYKTRDGRLLTSTAGACWGRRHAYEVGKAEQADPLAGYSNLTTAIKAGEPIDWERLDGRKAKCVSSDGVTVTYKLERDPAYLLEVFEGWYTSDSARAWEVSLEESWNGETGWALWIEGEIPLVRKTADELEVGTYFLGQAWGDSPCLAYVGRPLKTHTVKTIYYAPDMLKAITPPSEWVVLEEYGTFQKPEGVVNE